MHPRISILLAAFTLAFAGTAAAFDSDRLPPATGHYPLEIFGNTITGAAISPDGSRLWTSNGAQVIRWDLVSGAPEIVEYSTIRTKDFAGIGQLEYGIEGRLGDEFFIRLLQASPSGRFLAGNADFREYERPAIWDTKERSLRVLEKPGLIVAFSSDEKKVLMGLPEFVNGWRRVTRLAWVDRRNGKVGDTVFTDAGMVLEPVQDGVSVLVHTSDGRLLLLRPPYDAAKTIIKGSPEHQSLLTAPQTIWRSLLGKDIHWQTRDAQGQLLPVTLRATAGTVTVGDRTLSLFETDQAWYQRMAGFAAQTVETVRSKRQSGWSAIAPLPTPAPAVAAPAPVPAYTPSSAPPGTPPPSARDIARNIPLLPSGWRFSGGHYTFITLPNGNKALGAVQRCPDADVLLEAIEGSNSFSQWMNFTLARYDANGRSAPFTNLATWKRDGGTVALTPELSLSGGGQVTVSGATVYPNGHRINQQMSVSGCWIQ